MTALAALQPLPTLNKPQHAVALVWSLTVVAFLIALGGAAFTGLVTPMGDSYLLADRAKHLIQAGNLNVNNQIGGLIYPPLYAFFISPAYLTSAPTLTFKIILLIQSLLLATRVWPYYKLLTEYCRVAPRPAAWLAFALTLAPATLTYTYLVQTEVLYIPLLLWSSYFLLRAQEREEEAAYFAFGLGLGFMLLTRTAANTVIVGTLPVMALTLWSVRHQPAALRAKFAGLFCTAIGFVGTFGTWKFYEHFYVHYQAHTPYFTWAQIKPIFSHHEIFDIHFSWLVNAAFYYLASPLSIAACFLCVLCVLRRHTILRDPLAPFAISVATVSAVVVVIVMDTHYGGKNLTWNKYLMPYVYPLLLVAIRYRKMLTARVVNICGIVLVMMVLATMPSSLGCHFKDALALFSTFDYAAHLPEACINIFFALLLFVPAWLWARQSRPARIAAGVIVAASWLAANGASLWYYRNSGDLNITHYAGTAKKALDFFESHPRTAVFFDPDFDHADHFASLRTLFYWPSIIEPKAPSEISQVNPEKFDHIIYFCGQQMANETPVAQDRGAIYVYILDAKRLPGATAGLFMIHYDPSVWPQEVSVLHGTKYNVRWLQQKTDLQINNPGPERDVQIQLELATLDQPHTARLEVNGAFAPETYPIHRVFWSQGSETTTFHVHLRSGTNTLELMSPDPPTTLPGGRQVCFLMIGDIQITAPSP